MLITIFALLVGVPGAIIVLRRKPPLVGSIFSRRVTMSPLDSIDYILIVIMALSFIALLYVILNE